MARSNLNSVADRLRYARLLHPNMPATELSRRAKIGNSHASQIESGEIDKPSSDTLAKLAAVLRCDPGWLTWGKGAKPTRASVRS